MKMKKMKKSFKKFWYFANKPIEFKYFLLGLIFVAIVVLSAWEIYTQKGDMPIFFITLIAFLAAAIAIWQQHNAGIKQEIIGAWQILANKAAGNSGKIEAIEFLAKQRLSLQGIDMSAKTNGGQVYLQGLDVSKEKMGYQVDLSEANFEGANLGIAKFAGANLTNTNFKDANLFFANFKGANLFCGKHYNALFQDAKLYNAQFQGAYLGNVQFVNAVLSVTKFHNATLIDTHFKESCLSGANFEESKFFELTTFHNNYIMSSKQGDIKQLPKTPRNSNSRFEFDETRKPEPELNEKGKPPGRTKHFIKLVKTNEMD